ncbi:MAG TPA: OmpA family protein [Myxococcota bacterium]|nr:OmpA family protein [Myxococcota bacterium]OQC41116.1 MAG: Outer membrane lipoprotein Omp16 precursor [Deltaproteobacteria bacterium ADurb.Bin058]HHW96498.1 OmpA family protein [Oligoflexales bacterium]MBP8970058.1 OmpA family protein [Myxococcota bacterium]HQC44536.1 OmpA family protein [Myxococcota bacterium]
MSRVRLFSVIAVAAGAMMFSACGKKYPNCDTDKECASHGEYCVEGKCVQCRTNAHCSGDGPCAFCGAGNACQTPVGNPGDCCTSNENCMNGKCFKTSGATGVCAQCATTEDCGAGMKCVGGNCVPQGECGPGLPDCPEGKICQNGVCIVDECRLAPIYFDFDDDAISVDARTTLNKNYECMKEKGLPVLIVGHCDERGDDQYNMALGTKRARAGQKFLIKLGAKRKDVKISSKGEEEPVCTESYEGCWSRNRRDEFHFNH